MPVLPRLLLLLISAAQTPRHLPTPGELEIEVRENVRNQPLGDGTVADLALPEEFLARVADRIVRSSYEERYRIVVADVAVPVPVPEAAGDESRTLWIALGAAAVAVLAGGWATIARRRGARPS